MRFHKLGVLLSVSALISPLAVSAQEMTAEEILALLQAQREQLANQGELGTARTLEFVTESNPDNSGNGGMALVTEQPGDAIAASTEGMVMPEEMAIDLTIFFEFDSALLKSESKKQVDALCSAIEANEAANTAPEGGNTHGVYQIIGHTDASGSVAYNLSLSKARADEVVRYMVRECGIDATSLQAVGMGEGRLKDPSHPRADANRRVEIQVVL